MPPVASAVAATASTTNTTRATSTTATTTTTRAVPRTTTTTTTTPAPSTATTTPPPPPPPTRKREKAAPPKPSLALLITSLLIDYRWVFVVPVVLPLSYLFAAYWAWRGWVVRVLGKPFRTHDGTVKYIQKQIDEWRNKGSKGLLCSARPAFLMVTLRDGLYKTKDNAIHLPLWDILELDTEKRTVKVEPGVSIGQLTRFLIPKGWCIPVIPEYDDLTMGGMLFGYGIEGSSHKYGLFNDIVVSADVIVGTNELRIIPVKKYCRLVYEPVSRVDDMVKRFSELAEAPEPPEYLEGLQFDYHRGVLMHGDFADEVGNDGYLNEMGKWWKPWFHRHAELLSKKPAPDSRVRSAPRLLPPPHPLHLLDLRQHRPHGQTTPFSGTTLGWLMPPSVNFLKLTQTEGMKDFYFDKHVSQDYLVPLDKMKEGLDLAHQAFEVYPVWLCPHAVLKTTPQGAIRAPKDGAEIEQYVDIGIWGVPGPVPRGEAFSAHDAGREYETWLRKNRGYQAMYGITEMNEARVPRDAVRKKYGCEGVFMDAAQRC
ncbi:24-dehydrocholesterol reductase [Zopfochytrium polystomum]|nr:24-dehydrocholesterol reductase [Zopfochytrium polystomum]